MPHRSLYIFLLGVIAIALAAPAWAGTDVFRDVEALALPARTTLDAPLPRHFRAVEVDIVALENALLRAPAERSAAAAAEPLLVALPYPDGTDRLFRVEESPILAPELAARFPEIRTFVAQGVDDPSATARLSLTSYGFHAMVLSTSGTVFVDPYRRWDKRFALSYFKADARKQAGESFRCHADEATEAEAREESGEAPTPPVFLPAAASGTQLRTYRLALAGTGEYTATVCAPNPAAVACGLNAMAVSMNRINGVYEREVAIRMVIVANNNLVVYTDPLTDPYVDNDGNQMININTSNLNTVIGTANYDIGHVFSTDGGGVASSSPCNSSSKGRGVTGQPNPVGDGFDIDYVAHEMGHQFGGSHTFNAGIVGSPSGSCSSGNRSSSSAYEPGSGSTIMAYAGICSTENLQPHSDDTFHTRSFDQIVSASTAHSCPVITPTGNLPPTVSAGPSFTIPRQTPFTLTGSATDPDGDALTYMWEEFDLGPAAPPDTDVDATRPIFRSFVPLTVPSRTFPRLSDILNNVSTIGESLPTRNRTMTFRMTARDNRTAGGGVNYASTTVAVTTAAGPFLVTAPNTAVSWTGNTSQTVTWNVATTNVAPVSCANVAIDLSTDGGNTFTASLVASTPNDGSQAVTIPNTATTTARVRVSCVGNIFFDLSNANFTIVPGGGLPAPTVSSVSPNSGTTAGGTPVTLTGTGFVSGATVTFDTAPATAVNVVSATSITATTPAHAAGAVSVTVTNPDTQNGTQASAFTYTVPGPTGARFHTVTPCRVVDTRNPNGPTGGPALAGFSTRTFPIAGQCGVPADAVSAAVNVTVVLPTTGGNLRIFPAGITPPLVSTINFRTDQVRANNAVLALTGTIPGSIDVFADMPGTTHFLIDVTGYFR